MSMGVPEQFVVDDLRGHGAGGEVDDAEQVLVQVVMYIVVGWRSTSARAVTISHT
ncbi:hypothetical protein [Rhodococcus sp. WS3]|uniref:hypothetical protein n=1 Tax=Rhodococcus sp. WS3 TaxID=2486271 RepID=UPI001651380A|nr:hypothetical protein [Rhodococcus sp. WS3]